MTSTQNGGVLETKEIGLSISTSGTHFNTEIDAESNVLRLKKIGVSESGNAVYAEEGYWISNAINLEDKFLDFEKVFAENKDSGSSTISILTRVSDDGLNWSDWTAIAMDGTIQSETKQYIQVKINLYAGFTSDEVLIPNSDFETNEFVEVGQTIKLKRDYSYDMELDSTWTDEGSLHRKLIKRDDWGRIDKLEIE